MYLYKECSKCHNKLYLFENTAYTLTCQQCGCTEGVLKLPNNDQPQVLCLQCACDHIQKIKTNEEINFTHQCNKNKNSKIFKITNIEREKDQLPLPSPPADKKINTLQVSAIILCHNNLDLTIKCINRIRKSTIPCQIILIDNASIDETQNWARQQKDILYIRNQINLGCAIGRNQGAKYANCFYLFFVDNDQFISPETLKILLNKKADIVGVEKWEVISTDAYVQRAKNTSQEYKTYIGSGGMLIKKSVFEELQGYNERFAPAWYEDADFIFRARLQYYTIEYAPDAGIEHIGNQTISIQKDFDYKKAKIDSQRVFAQIWGDYLKNRNNAKALTRRKVGNPKILLIADVRGWAWDYKAQQIRKNLSTDFDIYIRYWHEDRDIFKPDNYDLIFSFECNFIPYLCERKTSLDKVITGVTAHTYVNFQNFKNSLKLAKAIYANSKLLFNEIKQYNPNCFYVPNGVDADLFKFAKRNIKKRFTAGYVGKGIKRKGLDDYIIPACQKAKVKLNTLVGRYDSQDKIKHADMPQFYEDIDCVIISSDMDGTPNQLLEGAAVGRTFIANRIGNVPEFIERDIVNGFMVERNIDAYIEKLLWLKKNREECAQMGIAARKTIEKEWTWAAQSKNYRNMFKQVLNL